MHNRRRLLVALGASALAAPFGSVAQQQAKVARIGFLGATSAVDFETQINALRSGLRELGYAEGKNIVIEYRWAEGKYDQLPALAAELVRLNVDLIVTRGTPAARVLQKATTTIPVIIYNVGDPVGVGLAKSLARPGGNITGFSNIASEIPAKHLEMLLSMAPKTSRVAVLVNPANEGYAVVLKTLQSAAQRTTAKILPVEAGTAQEIENAFSAMSRGKAGGVIVARDAFLNQQSSLIAKLAAKHRLPSIGAVSEYVEAGGLMSYGQDSLDVARRAAVDVDKVLKGAKPGDLPIQQPTIFELIINGKTAKALGLKVPYSLQIMANKVIE